MIVLAQIPQLPEIGAVGLVIAGVLIHREDEGIISVGQAAAHRA
jgi:hypothetical protein